MKKYLGLLFLITFICCKTKAVVKESNATKIESTDKIIENHYNNKKQFSNLYIKANVRYKDDKQSQNVTAEIRIKKNEKILVSIRLLGITMAKALITPDKVQYYEKIGGKYFEGNYASLSKWLGSDLDFYKLQNLFIGQALYDLKKDKYTNSIEDHYFKLESILDSNTRKVFYFESEKYLVKKEMISQPTQQRFLQVIYPNYKDYLETSLPNTIQIEARQENSKTDITIDYNNVSFNEEISFPYAVPEGYERIYID